MYDFDATLNMSSMVSKGCTKVDTNDNWQSHMNFLCCQQVDVAPHFIF